MNYYSYIKYGDKFFYPQGTGLLAKMSNVSKKIVRIDGSKLSFDEAVVTILKYEELDNEVFLSVGELMASKEEVGPVKFYESWLGKISFNMDTNEGDFTAFLFEKIRQGIDVACIPILMQYLNKVVKCNPVVYEYFEDNIIKLLYARNSCYNSYHNANDTMNLTMANILRLSTTNLLEIEKLISSNNQKYLELLLKKEDAKLEKGKKLNQVIDLPKFALEYIKENGLELGEEHIRNIANNFDGNTLKIIFKMFDDFKYYNKNQKSKRWGPKENTLQIKFLENVYHFLTKDYKITDVLNYLLRQRMYWSGSNGFNIPYEEANKMMDYLSICEKHGLNPEKYPQDLTKTHDIVVKNIGILSSHADQADNFKKVVQSYHPSDIEIGDYIFTAPKDIEDLIKEGNDLHHCIGNYTDNILKGISRIYFMRLKKSPEESLITVELNSTNDLVEFKENYNKEPDDLEVLKALNKFVKKKNK